MFLVANGNPAKTRVLDCLQNEGIDDIANYPEHVASAGLG